MEPIYVIEDYTTDDGISPFEEWLVGLKDKRAQAKVRARITRASFGNFGDWKPIKGAAGLCEMRDHRSPGYRVFYSVVGQKIVLLLAGSTKKDQNKAIAAATARLADYESRSKVDD